MRIKNYLTDSKRAGIRRAFQWVVIHGREFQEKEFLYRLLPAESRDRLVRDAITTCTNSRRRSGSIF